MTLLDTNGATHGPRGHRRAIRELHLLIENAKFCGKSSW